MALAAFDRRPMIVAIAGPNGAGKTSFYLAHLADSGLPFINADELAIASGVDPYIAAAMAEELRKNHLEQGWSFAFETVFSDPLGEKIRFLERAVQRGYEVVLCFIALPNVDTSMERVAIRVLQGGHDVPDDKLIARFPRTFANLRSAIQHLPHVLIFDNSNLNQPYCLVAQFERGKLQGDRSTIPAWLDSHLQTPR
ncbi:MAG: zeta toxin family protein [Pirellulales bacterium]|nr:zeta toxin family protein [Pirellulales bacterium]